MSEYPKGLRFDIYERFTLSEDVTAIEQLEDIELTPRITMQTQGDQAVLSGDLLLTGTYVGVGETRARSLSHRIPVEITLPLKRIRRMDNIGIEIENFDVEPLSDRTLNITGVISLNGIDTTAEQSWQERGEALFVHDAIDDAAAQEQDIGAVELVNDTADSTFTDNDASAASFEHPTRSADAHVLQSTPAEHIESMDAAEDRAVDVADEVAGDVGTEWATDSTVAEPAVHMEEQLEDMSRLHGSEAESEDVRVEPAPPAPQPVPNVQEQVSAKVEAEAVQPAKEPAAAAKLTAAEANEQNASLSPQEYDTNDAPQDTLGLHNAAVEESTDEWQTMSESSESKEMKIAFGSSKQSDSWSGSAAGVKSLLQQVDENQAVSERPDDLEAGAQERETEQASVDDAVQWKNLFLSSEQEGPRFSKVRMCIVQREETLDMIASRYSLNPKEIVLYNRLDSEQISEGQVIYIPG